MSSGGLPHSIRVSAILLVAAVAGAADVPLPRAQPLLILRLEGWFTRDRSAARAVGGDPVTIGFGGSDRTRWFGVREARTVSGDHFLDGRDVIARLAPLQPNLFVVGPPELRARLLAVPPETPVRIEGLISEGRTYLLREVTVEDQGTGP